jgi:hypothetical protein
MPSQNTQSCQGNPGRTLAKPDSSPHFQFDRSQNPQGMIGLDDIDTPADGLSVLGHRFMKTERV